MDWHSVLLSEVLKELQVDPDTGLRQQELPERHKKYGKNEIPGAEKVSFIKVFFGQFKSPLIYLLLLAAVAAFLMGEVSDSLVIFFVVTLNSIIGSFQESRAEKSLHDLKKITKIMARIRRDGNEFSLPSEELVPGDIVFFNAGDAISADCRIIEDFSLAANESILTGESAPVEKLKGRSEQDAPLGDRMNMLYSGTFITAGRATAVVTAIGVESEIGKIAELTNSVEEPLSPLMTKIHNFSRALIYISGFLFFLIVLIGRFQGISLREIIMVAIGQIVSLVPEGLPVAITVAAAVGVQRMAARKTIVRKLQAVEALGSTSIICSDKTGTLTMNRMTVTEVMPASGKRVDFTKEIKDADEDLKRILLMAVLCNDSSIQQGKEIGDPTETALLKAAFKIGILKREADQLYKRTKEIPFDSAVKMMATQHEGNGENFVALKGATDGLLELTALTAEQKEKISEMNEAMAQNALRVLTVAWVPGEKLTDSIDGLKGKVQLLGLIGEMDPPREEVKAAIEECRKAGIRPVMITGDHKTTGLAVARMIGLAGESDRAVEGKDLDENLGDIDHIAVFARVHPSQKLKLVEAFQKAGHVVAMTGDGVNDAPALGKADVGVAMGITGTEVAKEASKIIVTDDNFSTIVSAIAEGRLVYQNIKKVLLLLVSTSIDEVIILLLALLLGFPPPFAAVQILWNNLVTDGIMTVNLIMEPPEGREMEKPPVSRSEPLINRIMFQRILFFVPATCLSTLGWFVWRINSGVDLGAARTETLTMLVVCQWFVTLSVRSEVDSAFSWNILKNKWLFVALIAANIIHALVIYWRPLGDYFHTVPIEVEVVPLIALVGSLVLWVEELRKWVVRRKRRKVWAHGGKIT